MRRLPCFALLLLLLLLPAPAVATPGSLRELDRVPDDPSLPVVHPVSLGGAHPPARLPDPSAKPRIPEFLKFSRRADVRAADHFTGRAVKEEQYQDEHGHVLTLATDNPGVDLEPFAALLASTYHYGEIEFVHVFVTNERTLTEICGQSAAACYGADDPERSPAGAMIVSYEDSDIRHAVIHEYGHHVDTNTYNLGRLSDCGTSGDGSRRWFFAREMEDRILDNLSCDPRGDWGQLLPEVFAEDYAQMAGIPASEYHPAITVRPPSSRQKRELRADMDTPFTPVARKLKGRGRKAFRVRAPLPVFLSTARRRGVRTVRASGCTYEGFSNVFEGTCRVVVTPKVPGGRFSLSLALL